MITYEVKLKKIGEMTILPDSQRLFGFLVNYSKRYCAEEEISSFVKGVREQEQKCMISSIMPSGYYPTPKEYILQKLQIRLEYNQEKIGKLEEEQVRLKKESESLIQELSEKSNLKKELMKEKEKKALNDEIKKLKSEVEEIKEKSNKNSVGINNLSSKTIYETLKRMDFLEKNQLKELLELGKTEGLLEVKDLEKFKFLKKSQTFIQKFRLESQMKELPGMPNIAYSLPILSFVNQNGDIQKQFSFFVKVEEASCIAKALEGMKNRLIDCEIPCFLGEKGSAGYNEYRICDVEKSKEDGDGEQSLSDRNYLNLGVLLPNFDNIDAENSILEIYTSDRKPFEIENEIPKVISFITAGSVIKIKEGCIDLYKTGESIDNSKYNPMYKKNAIIFGNSYLVRLEAYDEN